MAARGWAASGGVQLARAARRVCVAVWRTRFICPVPSSAGLRRRRRLREPA